MAQDLGDEAADQRKDFAEGLLKVLSIRGVSQRKLAELMGLTQGAINGWCSGQSEPPHRVVFEVEKALELPPGHLSHHLGYLPVEARRIEMHTFEEVVLDDPNLTSTVKRSLISFYRTAIEPDPTRPGRRPATKAAKAAGNSRSTSRR